MSDPLIRVLVVVVALAVAVVVGRLWSLRRRDGHPMLDLDGLGLPAGLIVFTSTTCEKCKAALTVAKDASPSVREVTWELEPGVQEAAGVHSVPLTVVATNGGRVVAQFKGVPSRRRLRSALRRAGR